MVKVITDTGKIYLYIKNSLSPQILTEVLIDYKCLLCNVNNENKEINFKSIRSLYTELNKYSEKFSILVISNYKNKNKVIIINTIKL